MSALYKGIGGDLGHMLVYLFKFYDWFSCIWWEIFATIKKYVLHV